MTAIFEEAFVPLSLAFLALVFFAPIVDGVVMFLERVMLHFPRLPNNFGARASFLLTVLVAYCLCWRAEFDFYAYLGMGFSRHEGWLITAILLSGGTKALKRYFDLANLIPVSIFGGISSAVKRVGRGGNANN